MKYYDISLVASAYGTCAYGTSNFQDTSGTCATTSTGGGSSAGGTGGVGGVLTNTGFEIAVVVTAACLIALTAVIVKFVRRPAKETVRSDS